MSRTALALFFTLASLVAQEAPTARHFLPQDYKTVLHVDMVALRDRDIWADLEVSALKLMFGQLERDLGFPLAHLDRFTLVQDLGDPAAAERVPGGRRTISVLEGNTALEMPQSVLNGRWSEEKIGTFEVLRRREYDDHIYLQPRPNLLVDGDTELLRASLTGERGAGSPSADVMSLMSGRGTVLAYVIFDLGQPVMRDSFLDTVAADSEWPDGDWPTFFGLRALVTGDEDDPHITLEAIVRHAQVGKGLDVTDTTVDGLLAMVRANPQMLIVRRMLKNLDKQRDGSDLVMRLDLGRARTAAGELALLMVPMLLASSTDAQVIEAQPVQVELVEQAGPEPLKPPTEKQPKPKEEGGGGR